MNYTAAAERTWRPTEGGSSGRDLLEIIRYATLAASSHNTQPWRFVIARDRIRILPDFSRRCRAVDPDDHHLFASLGCAAENLLHAALAGGFRPTPAFDPVTRGMEMMIEPAASERSALFDAIPLRQCSRSQYDGSSLSPDELRALERAGTGSGVTTILLTSAKQKDEVAGYVAQANSAQFADPAWRAELESWIRFSGREAVDTGDGLYGPIMGSPDVPRWFGRAAMKLFSSSKAQNRKDARCIASSGAIAVITSDRDEPSHWIEAGRCHERIALQATVLGLRTAFINQPVEVSAIRQQFASYLGLGGRRPDLVIRLGRGPAMPRSLRRPVGDVTVDTRAARAS